MNWTPPPNTPPSNFFPQPVQSNSLMIRRCSVLTNRRLVHVIEVYCWHHPAVGPCRRPCWLTLLWQLKRQRGTVRVTTSISGTVRWADLRCQCEWWRRHWWCCDLREQSPSVLLSRRCLAAGPTQSSGSYPPPASGPQRTRCTSCFRWRRTALVDWQSLVTVSPLRYAHTRSHAARDSTTLLARLR